MSYPSDIDKEEASESSTQRNYKPTLLKEHRNRWNDNIAPRKNIADAIAAKITKELLPRGKRKNPAPASPPAAKRSRAISPPIAPPPNAELQRLIAQNRAKRLGKVDPNTDPTTYQEVHKLPDGQIVCRYFGRNGCTRGERCTFAHVILPGVPHRPLICKYFGTKTGCVKGSSCSFVHLPPDDWFN